MVDPRLEDDYDPELESYDWEGLGPPWKQLGILLALLILGALAEYFNWTPFWW